MVSAIILSAGSSSRMGGENKQLALLCGIPVFVQSALRFEQSEKVQEIIIAAPKNDIPLYEKLAKKHMITKLKAVVSGGETRFLSVKNALDYVDESADFIAIHDGARPLIETDDINRIILDAEKYGCAIAAACAADTIKLVGEDGIIQNTPPRERLYCAQTPQIFRKKMYFECVKKLGKKSEFVTDDSCIAEQCGENVHITEITRSNMKITRPDDLAAAEAILLRRRALEK